jgi:PAS domain-containing protein
LNIFKKCNDYLGFIIYGDIETKLDKILEEIERDKTRTENLEKELQKARLKMDEYKNLVLAVGETIPDMMWAKDLNGRYIYANGAILKGLFYNTDYRNIIGKNDVEIAQICKDLVGPENHTFGEICGNSDLVVLENLKKERFLEWGLINGNDIYLEVYKAPLYDCNGAVAGTVGTGRDITEWYSSIKDAVLNSNKNSGKGKTGFKNLILQQLDKYKFEG